MKAVMTNNILTVILSNGEIFSSSNGTRELYLKIIDAENEDEIKQMLVPELYAKEQKFREEIEKVKTLEEGSQLLIDTGEFEWKDGAIYMVGINRSLPHLLIERFCKILNDATTWDPANTEYQALKNFWYWCCLNPRAEVADTLFEFLEKNTFKINAQGLFYALRNVVTVDGDGSENTLTKVVSENFVKIKSQKKGPGNFFVWVNGDGEYKVAKERPDNEKGWRSKGNLKIMYEKLPKFKSNRYTDDRTRTFDIRVGQRVAMNPEDCHWGTEDCGRAGLHGTLNEINYVGCGDTSVIMLVNPMKVVGIGHGKFRCWEYLPISTIPRDQATQFLKDGDFDGLDIVSEYAGQEIENLETKAKEGFSTEAKKHDFHIPQITSSEINNISKILNDNVRKTISNRVVTV